MPARRRFPTRARWLVAEAHRAGIRVSPLPGPSAAAAALSVVGLRRAAVSCSSASCRPPLRARRKALDGARSALAGGPLRGAAPHRATPGRTCAQRFGDCARGTSSARELTKKFEEVARLPLGEAPAWLAGARANAAKASSSWSWRPAPSASGRRWMPSRFSQHPARSAVAPSEAATLAAQHHRRAEEPALPQGTRTDQTIESEVDGPAHPRRPDDWHLHLRDGAALAAVLADTARRFARAIVMPNLKPRGAHHGAGARTTASASSARCPTARVSSR